MTEKHREVIKREFGRQAPRFANRRHTVASRVYLEWVVENLDLQSHFTVLDVAAGTGLLGRAIAPYVKQVIALDATPDMLFEGRRQAEQDGLGNIVFAHGLAEELPYPNDAFDMVVSRFAIHHFEDPRPPMTQMVRVCRPGGTVAVVDLVSPDGEAVAGAYNRLERMRDPSHARALSVEELRTLVQEVGLDFVYTVSRTVEVTVDGWFDLTQTAPDVRRAIEEELTKDLEGVHTSGMRPFYRDNALMFLQTWVIVVGAKP
jgi:ubiquinone/menaquinone biosynthesis C-methylase UbiE